MKKTLLAGLATGLLILGVSGNVYATPVQWTTGAGGNGHWYEIVDASISWSAASTAAVSAGGYLATITSENEQQFVASLIASHVSGITNIGDSGYIIGGFQPTGSTGEPGGNWQWVTGEAWVYTNWGVGEPNNSGVENYLYMDERYTWAWNDYIDAGTYYRQPSGYIIESVPEPATMLLFGTGIAGLAAVGRRRRS